MYKNDTIVLILIIVCVMTRYLSEVNENFYIDRYKNGIKLIKPDLIEKRNNAPDLHCITDLYHLPCSVYFLNYESKCRGHNNQMASSLGESSTKGFNGKDAHCIFKSSY